MKETLEYIAKKILPHPDAVEVIEETEDDTTRLTLITHPEDIGLAIGKNGKTVRALRELLKIRAVREGTRVYVDVQTPDEREEENSLEE